MASCSTTTRSRSCRRSRSSGGRRAMGETFGAQPVGTGPFKFVRWERGKEIVLEANEEYFDGAPRLSRLVFRIFPGEQRDAMQDEFQKGNLEDAPVPARVDRRELVA